MIWLFFGLFLVGNLWQLFVKPLLNSGKHIGSVTAASMFVSAVVSLMASVFFEWSWPVIWWQYITPLLVAIVLAISTRIEIVARKILPVSEVVLINRLRSVMFVIVGVLLLGEEPGVMTIVGAVLIILANILITYQKGSFVINKYFWQLVLADLLVVLSTLIDVEVSKSYNLGFFMAVSFAVRGLFFIAFDPITIKDVMKEFLAPYRWKILLMGAALTLSVLVTVRGFQLFPYSIFEPLRSVGTFVTIILAAQLYREDKENIARKIFASLLVIIGVILIEVF